MFTRPRRVDLRSFTASIGASLARLGSVVAAREIVAMSNANVIEAVRDYYGRVLSSSSDLKTSACCASAAPPAWLAPKIANVHDDVQRRFYGCGFPIPHALAGGVVVDLGCGTGRDAFVLAQLVGEHGRVIGVDMTEEQLRVARDTEQWHAQRFGYAKPNTSFHTGFIEDLAASGVADNSVDVVVSNCVVNLSPRKDLVLAEAFRVLKAGGELYFSDVFADRRLPAHVANDPVLYGECLGGAMYDGDFVQLAKKSGFTDPRRVSTSSIRVDDPALAKKIGSARFASVTMRLFKLAGLDEQCEDYGQIATYRGGLDGAQSVFWLDDHHAFEARRPERVCGNTADMIRSTRFAPFFDVTGSKETHFGAFPCGPTMAARASPSPSPSSSSSSSSSTSGACC
jgi:ubiquinone/menaquinone biosynthesis C-methylase UbiE